MEQALKKEQSLSHAESIDQYMPTQSVINAMQTIDEQCLKEVMAIPKTDPEYAQKVKAIEERAKQTKYKSMKNLNT